MLEKDRQAPRQHPYLTTREPRIGVTLASRHHGLPDHVLQIAWRAQHRLHRVHRRLRAHHKPPNVVNVACARELACFIWAAATSP
jgi:transposase